MRRASALRDVGRDNEDAAEMVSEFLRALGHDVRVAHDGQRALETIGAFAAEIALLDIGLPGMDGYELARRIRHQNVRVRLIAVTGDGQESDRQQSRAAGFSCHLTKPLALGELIENLEPTSSG